jgi:uncharacterized protein
MGTKYLDLARLGKNNWWRYLLGFGTVVFAWVGVSVVVLIGLTIWAALDGDPATALDPATGRVVGFDPFIDYLTLNVGHVAMALAVFFVIYFLHERSVRSLVTIASAIRWRLFARGFGLYAVLMVVGTVVDFVLHPQTYRISLDAWRFLAFAPMVLILTPIQACAEEFLFRGYLMQGIGLLTSRWIVPAVGSSLIFMAVHLGNPELAHGLLPMVLYYFGMGLFLALLTLKSDGLELSMGVHTATCIFAALVVNYEDSVLKTDSIFFCTNLDPVFGLITFLVAAAVFWVIMFRRPPEMVGVLGADQEHGNVQTVQKER